jgi:hypothetical protein
MPLPLLLLLADPETAVDAERAFNRAAQTEGQWTAFRKFATDDAVIFTPQPAKVQEALPKKDPPIAVQWWPAESHVSCDGTVAVNTGPWVRPKAVGYFTTVWVRQPDGRFKWVMDGGDTLESPRALPEKPRVIRASCRGKPVPPITSVEGVTGSGGSADFTLVWTWRVKADGARTFSTWLWDGREYRRTVVNEVAAPPQ